MFNRAIALAAVLIGILFLVGLFGGDPESGSASGAPPLVPTSSTIDITALNLEPQTHDEPIEALEDMNGAIVPDLPGDPLDGVVITSNAAEDYPIEQFVRLATDMVTAELTGAGAEQYPWLASRLIAPCCEEVIYTSAAVTFPAEAGGQASIRLEWNAVDTNGDPLTSATETFWTYDGNTWRSEFES